MTTLTAAMQARLKDLLGRGMAYRNALALADTVTSTQAPAPWDFLLFGLTQPAAIPQGSWGWAYNANQAMTYFSYNATPAQNDEFRWYTTVNPGTYRFDMIADRDPTRAINTWEISLDGGVTWQMLAIFDQYAAAAATNAAFSSLNIVITGSGPAIIRCRVAARNAASTGWYMTLTYAVLRRTA